MAQKQNKAREMLCEMFLSSLREERLPWQQPWVDGGIPKFGHHKNPVSGTMYHGVNAVILWAVAMKNQYEDPRWCTFNQSKEKGWSVRKGEHGTPVEFWSFYDTKNKKTISATEFERIRQGEKERVPDIKPCSRVYTVFNGVQIEGIPKLPSPEKLSPQFVNTLMADFTQRYLENAGLGFSVDGYGAFYNLESDTVTMPPKQNFYGEMEYYDTLFHEFAHSTAHPSRLNREITGDRSTKGYAVEELRAEISGAFIVSATGGEVPKEITSNNKAYVQSWALHIQDDPNVLFRAIKDAEEIANYVEEKGCLEQLLERQSEKEALEAPEPPKQRPIEEEDAPEL